MSPFGALVVAYLIGAIPSAYLAARWVRGIDLREHGSGNVGATNAFRVLGPRIAVPVLTFDIVKGFVPVAVLPLLDSSAHWEWALAYGAAAIIGHVLPVYLGFRGGKGVATAAGVFLALAPVAAGAAFLVWSIVLWAVRIVSVASIAAAVSLVTILFLIEERILVTSIGIAVAALVIVAHRDNIRRILAGTERRI